MSVLMTQCNNTETFLGVSLLSSGRAARFNLLPRTSASLSAWQEDFRSHPSHRIPS